MVHNILGWLVHAPRRCSQGHSQYTHRELYVIVVYVCMHTHIMHSVSILMYPGHSEYGTHSSSLRRTVPSGHAQPGLHCALQNTGSL